MKNIYSDLNSMLKGRCASRKKVGNNTYAHRMEDSIAVQLHSTDVVKLFSDGRVQLNSGGWKTVTTKARMNEFSPFCISQRKGVWFVSQYMGDGKHVELGQFNDNMVLTPLPVA